MLGIETIEDCLELLAGFRKESSGFQLNKEDYTIMHSIARQAFKGTALTDRQFNLMQKKLLNYNDQFNSLDICLENCIKKLRQPLREIDRSKYIKLVDNKIIIRFPFKKSYIMLINEISHIAEGYTHKKGTHQHIFDYTEQNVLNLLDRFCDKNFKCDKEIAIIYHEIKHMEQQKHRYVPGIYDMQLKNVPENLKLIIEKDLGILNSDSLIRYVDRRFKYALEHVDPVPIQNSLEGIAYREERCMQSKPSIMPLDTLLFDLWNLDRFPMLVILDKENPEKQLHSMLNFYRDILDTSQQSVLFRLEDKNAGFNQLVKDRKVNNWVDKSTKIVYTSNNKLPKLLVNNDWEPTVAFGFTSAIDKNLNTYVNSMCDLIIFREEYGSPFRRYSKIYG